MLIACRGFVRDTQAYMQPLFELTLRTIREDQEEVALAAMEFWSSLCDEEVGVVLTLVRSSTRKSRRESS